MTSNVTRDDTLIVGPIEDGAFFTIVGSTEESFGVFYYPYISGSNIQFFQSRPVPQYDKLLYFNIKLLSDNLVNGVRTNNVVITIYSNPDLSAFLGYVDISLGYLTVSNQYQYISIITSDPSQYLYSAILSSVRYQFNANATITTQKCDYFNPLTLSCGSISMNVINTNAFNFMFIPLQWYDMQTCTQQYYGEDRITSVPTSILLSQCYYVDNGNCGRADQVSGFTTESDCARFRNIGKYYYSQDQCNASFSFTNLQGVSTDVTSSLGTCSDGVCSSNSTGFSCYTAPEPPAINDGSGGGDDGSDDSSTRWLLLGLIGLIIIIFVIVVVVAIVVLVSKPKVTTSTN